MSEQYKKRVTASYDDSPIVTYYQFKAIDEEKAEELIAAGKGDLLKKIKVMKKGNEIVGSFLHTFEKEFTEKDGTKKMTKTNHLFITKDGKISIKGCTNLNKGLDGLAVGDKVKIVYLGKGKAAPGRTAPYMFDVFDVISPPVAAAEESEDDSADAGDEDETIDF